MSATFHTDTYWSNRFGGRFVCEEHALEDEARRLRRPWKLRVIGTAVGESPDSLRPRSIEAIDDSKAPYTGQRDGTAPVWLFADLVSHYQALLDKYGPNGGYTYHHCGMGLYSDELVQLEPNPAHVT